MKKKILKRGMSGLLAVLMAFTTLIGMGTTAFAVSETAESYMVSYPRDGDAVQVYDQSTWGHSAKTYMNGWSTQSSNVTTIHCMDSYDGKVCYCIEPGVPRNVGDSYSGFGENFWDNYPSQYNNTIKPDDIKVLLGRIMQYGYQGNISTSWKSQNAADADKMAHAIATQLLVWETVIPAIRMMNSMRSCAKPTVLIFLMSVSILTSSFLSPFLLLPISDCGTADAWDIRKSKAETSATASIPIMTTPHGIRVG